VILVWRIAMHRTKVCVSIGAVFGLVLGSTLLRPTPVQGQDRPAPSDSASQVLDQMVNIYRTCKTYRDTGVVRTVYLQGGSQRTQERPFSTAFARPDSFRFQFTDTSPNGEKNIYIVWQQGSDVRTWWNISDPNEKRSSSLDLAIAGATGVSGRSAHTVPILLLPQVIKGRSLKDLTEPKRLEDAPCGGGMCARIEGVFSGDEHTLWIDLGTFLLRRIDSGHTFPAFQTTETTSYEPVINEAIGPDLLAFGPPQQRRGAK